MGRKGTKSVGKQAGKQASKLASRQCWAGLDRLLAYSNAPLKYSSRDLDEYYVSLNHTRLSTLSITVPPRCDDWSSSPVRTVTVTSS
jgi:hypothetical protein